MVGAAVGPGDGLIDAHVIAFVAFFHFLFFLLGRIDASHGPEGEGFVFHFGNIHRRWLIVFISQDVGRHGAGLVDGVHIDPRFQMVAEAKVQIPIGHSGVAAHGRIGYRREVTGSLGHLQACQDHCIEKGAAHLAHAAAGAGLELPIDDHRRFQVTIIRRTGAGGLVIGEIATGLHIDTADAMGRQLDVLAAIAAGREVSGILPQHRIDGCRLCLCHFRRFFFGNRDFYRSALPGLQDPLRHVQQFFLLDLEIRPAFGKFHRPIGLKLRHRILRRLPVLFCQRIHLGRKRLLIEGCLYLRRCAREENAPAIKAPLPERPTPPQSHGFVDGLLIIGHLEIFIGNRLTGLPMRQSQRSFCERLIFSSKDFGQLSPRLAAHLHIIDRYPGDQRIITDPQERSPCGPQENHRSSQSKNPLPPVPRSSQTHSLTSYSISRANPSAPSRCSPGETSTGN